MCDSPPGENDDNSIVSGGSTIYSTPVAQLGSTNDLANAATSPPPLQNQQSTNLKSSSSTNNKMNNVQESSRNVSEPKTGNQNAMTPKQEMHLKCIGYILTSLYFHFYCFHMLFLPVSIKSRTLFLHSLQLKMLKVSI